MRYIIEIEEETFEQNNHPTLPTGTNTLYRVKGFDTLVFTEEGLKKLEKVKEPYAVFTTQKEYQTYFKDVEENSYKRGREDGYRARLFEDESIAARSVAEESDIYQEGYRCGAKDAWEAACRLVDCEWPERRLITGDTEHTTLWDMFNNLTGEKAIQCVKNYDREEHVDLNIKAGDEVIGPLGNRYIVIGVTGMGTVAGLEFHGGALNCCFNQINTVKRTGRSFPELIEIFRKVESNGKV